jgi:hypothetical protein
MKQCLEPNCGRKRYALGLCPKHYKRQRKTGSTLDLQTLEHSRLAEALDWILDGEPLTTPAERAQHDLLAA